MKRSLEKHCAAFAGRAKRQFEGGKVDDEAVTREVFFLMGHVTVTDGNQIFGMGFGLKL